MTATSPPRNRLVHPVAMKRFGSHVFASITMNTSSGRANELGLQL